jgi:eukaryotic-like serine/threonine-protein kinase
VSARQKVGRARQVSPTLIADRYRLIQQLGQGGMGRVWRGYDEVLGREVAVKEVVAPPGVPEDERKRLRERSMREARAIARLNHANVIRVFDVVTTASGDPWIVMEYVKGKSLQEVMPVSPMWAATIGLGLLSALRAAHKAGITHRDVKPSNVLLASDGRVLLTDWGIATVPGDPNITQTGVMFGSPAYMAPERVHDSHAGPVSDLWSLGATLYAAVEGKSPYARATTMATLAALTTDPVPAAPHAGPLAPVLNGLLRKDPTLRMRPDEAERLLNVAKIAPAKPLPTKPVPATSKPAQPKPAQPKAAKAAPTPAKPKATAVMPRVRSAPPAPPAPVRQPARPAARPPVRRKPRRIRWLFLLGLLLLLLCIFKPWDDPDHQGQTPPASVPSVESSPSALAPSSAAPSSEEPSPEPSASPPPAGFQLPPGWTMVHDRTGFAVPVPNGWVAERDSAGRPRWRDPRNGTFLLIDQRRDPQPDPVQDWKNNEAARADSYRGYHRIRIEAVDYWDKAADWEFTYISNSGTRLHVLNRGFITAPDQAYSIYWSTTSRNWDAETQRLQVVLAGFQPARS